MQIIGICLIFLIVGERVTIYIRKSTILGIKREDGIIYCYFARPFMAVLLILCGIATLLVFCIGILFMWMGWAEILNYQFVAELKNKGAIEISM